MTQFLTFTNAEWSAITLSLKVAFWAMLGSLPLGILCALVLARGRFHGKALLNALVHLPLVLPPVVTGYVLLYNFGKRSAFGQFLDAHLNFSFSFRWTGAALACAVMGFPLMVRAIKLSIDAVDQKLEAAASTLGARPIWVMLTITLPLALPGIVAGMILSFAKAMGEFGATITFVSNIPGETQTLPTLIYTYTQVPDGDAAVWRLTLISVCISIAALLVSEALAARAQGRLASR
jgi:molybdate transport system permease protein